MWQQQYRRALRQARRRARAQQQALPALEIAGVVAVTLHSLDASLTVAVSPDVGRQLTGTLHEALREQRQAWRAELRQLRAATGPPPPRTNGPATGPDPPQPPQS